MNDPHSQTAPENQADPDLVHAAITRGVAKDVLNGVAAGVHVAAGVVMLLMVVVWIQSSSGDHLADFPGRYLLALLPLLAAGLTLHVMADRVGRGL